MRPHPDLRQGCRGGTSPPRSGRARHGWSSRQPFPGGPHSDRGSTEPAAAAPPLRPRARHRARPSLLALRQHRCLRRGPCPCGSGLHHPVPTPGISGWGSKLYYYKLLALQTPSPMEMVERTLVLLDRARRIWNFLNAIESIRDWFYNLHPYLQMFLFSVFLAPFEALYQDTLSSLQDLVNHLVPSAQEPSCPFLGLRSLSYEDCPVNECLLAVLHLSASAAGAITMIVGGVCICSCLDVMDLLRLFDKKSPLKPVNFVTSSAMVDHSTMNKFKKIVLKVIANGLSEQETVALTKDAAGGIITVCDLKGVIKRGGSQLTNSEVTALFNAIDMDSSGAISSAEFIAATLQMSYMGSPSGFSLYGFGAIGLVTMDDAAHDCRAMFWTLPVSRSLP